MALHIDMPYGVATGVGSLPHRDAAAAAQFVFAETPLLPAIPTLPRRSPAEGMIAQAAVGVAGITQGQYGSLAIDAAGLDPLAPVITDLDDDAFVGLQAFLIAAQSEDYQGPVKWQFVGPITFGLALVRAGVPSAVAFAVAVQAVREHVRSIHHAVSVALPNSSQIVMIDEPSLVELSDPEFPLAPDSAIDLLSSAMAVVEATATVGVHCCGQTDWATVLAAGPSIISLPVDQSLVEIGGYLARFLEQGGWIAWGAVPTDGPMSLSSERPWQALAALWCELVNHGCDPYRLRRQALITPACGLGLHADEVAGSVFQIVREISERVHTQAMATRLSIGA
jgi:methionine synthase II (cobalamin-independent)